jgi:hypothetical protein
MFFDKNVKYLVHTLLANLTFNHRNLGFDVQRLL